jgi:tRNA dimethylallyltransferase
MTKKLFILLGPTGIGKTNLSIQIAQYFNCPILSCDSRQFYKEMRIGTAVPSADQLKAVKHFFIGNKSIHDYYNVYQFETEALQLMNELFQQLDALLMVGGSGMYIDVICKGIDDIPDIDPDLRERLIEKYEEEGIESLRFDVKKLDPEYYEKVDLKNKNRMLRAVEVKLQTGKTLTSFRKNKKAERDFEIIKIGLERNREELYDLINQRVDQMMDKGLLEEAKNMHPFKESNALNTVGYKELFEYFEKKISLEKAIELIKRNTRRYAKRQITWFNRDKEIHWFNADDHTEIQKFIASTCDLI